MEKIDQLLEEVEQDIRLFCPAKAEAKIRSLLETMGKDELGRWEPDIRRVIQKFNHKRQRDLARDLNTILGKAPEAQKKQTPSPSDIEKSKRYANELELKLSQLLRELSDKHIFQWSTFYREFLSPYFTKALDYSNRHGIAKLISNLQRRLIANHSKEIFVKGFLHQTSRYESDPQNAVKKSIAGLQRFLELPIEFYAAKASDCGNVQEARNLIRITSSFIVGILEGYGDTDYGLQTGWQILPRFPRSWAHTLGFFTKYDVNLLLEKVEPGDLRDGLSRTLPSLVGAIEEIGQRHLLLPALAQIVWDSRTRRLDISLRPPRQSQELGFIEVQCYLDPAFSSLDLLGEALTRHIALVLIPLRPDLQRIISEKPELAKIVVEVSEEKNPNITQTQIINLIEGRLYEYLSPKAAAAPITYNFARNFPLRNPSMTRYYHVPRSSINTLLRTFERRNGIRLWCSVRRSGKTTACFDLGSTTGLSTIVSQTCDTTHQLPASSLFYDAVCDAIRSGDQLEKTFFSNLVARCGTRSSALSDRYVFVLDEYETLFGLLDSSVDKSPYLRYMVVQPLLNQIVSFTRDNLVVFLGQHPDAHYILMDQNQLSAYVEQDAFPLFAHSHGEVTGEFNELVRKVLTTRVVLAPNFVDALFEETSGHPFLTVNLLVDFVDWLISKQWHLGELTFDSQIFSDFVRDRLDFRSIGICKEYSFFINAVSRAIGYRERDRNPWLYAIYNVLRAMALYAPDTFAFSRTEFDHMIDKLSLQEKGIIPDHVLSTGCQANFFAFDGNEVIPNIRILARIAGTTNPQIIA